MAKAKRQSDNIFGSCMRGSRIRKKGVKPKTRRAMRAWANDGGERKKAGGLAPALRPSKQALEV